MRIQRGKLLLVLLVVGIGAATWLTTASSAQTGSFANQTPIVLNDNAVATPYPSTINVAGLVGTVTKVTATIYSYHDQLPEDVDVLLSGPTGKTTMLMADDCQFDGSIKTVTFDDAAATAMPDEGPCPSGTFRPSVGVINSTGSLPHPANWTPPAPPCPCGTTMSNQNGVNPNGVWNLWALDDTGGGSGQIDGGWSLTITTNAGTLTVTKQLVSNPADPGKFNLLIDNVVLAACVGNGGTTGPVVEPPNTFHLVSETACAGTNLSNYTPSISCSNGQHTGGTSLFVFVAANANVTCIIRNQRKLFRVGGT